MNVYKEIYKEVYKAHKLHKIQNLLHKIKLLSKISFQKLFTHISKFKTHPQNNPLQLYSRSISLQNIFHCLPTIMSIISKFKLIFACTCHI